MKAQNLFNAYQTEMYHQNKLIGYYEKQGENRYQAFSVFEVNYEPVFTTPEQAEGYIRRMADIKERDTQQKMNLH